MVYENIVEISKKKNLSITEVEKRAGLGRGAIGKWQVSSPTVSKLAAVADVLGVSIHRLMKNGKSRRTGDDAC